MNFVKGMQAISGNDIDIHVAANSTHAIFSVGHLTGFRAEAVEAAKSARLFLDKRLSIRCTHDKVGLCS